jgi:hypothetical protein
LVLAALTLVLSGLGIWRYRRVPIEDEILDFRTATTATQKLAASPS